MTIPLRRRIALLGISLGRTIVCRWLSHRLLISRLHKLLLLWHLARRHGLKIAVLWAGPGADVAMPQVIRRVWDDCDAEELEPVSFLAI